MTDRQRKMAELALDAIGEVQVHVDAESIREEQLADLWNRWKCLKPDEPGAMVDKEGNPIEPGWYLDTLVGLTQMQCDILDYSKPPVLCVFDAGGEWWACDQRGASKMTKEWAARLLKITTPFCGV